MSEFKIHHTVSELFSLLGISDSPEKYTEVLNGSVQHYVSTQLTAANAVKTLAEGSPNPEAFLHKYDELKSRNVQHLDALMVLMEGVVKEGKVRKVVEEPSKLKLLQEGQSLTTVPNILAEIEHATENKLSTNQLNELRNRLLKESQVSHAPSEALIKVMGETKESHPGPPMPAWLTDRTFLSLDFVQVPRDPNIGPLGEINSVGQEHELIEDVLSLMLGFEGSYITVHLPSQTHHPPTFTIDPSVEQTHSRLLSRILPLCGHYSLVIRFIEEKSNYRHGLVNQALAAAMRNLLKDYMRLVTQLERLHQRFDLTLHKLWFYAEKTLRLMEILSSLAAAITKSCAHGGGVLSLLHERCMSLIGCGQLQDMMVYLIQAAAQPYFNMLATWIYRGIINDPYKEFLVVDRETGHEDSSHWTQTDLTDDYWEKRYSTSTTNIPSFLQSHADMILRTGKYLNVIRQSDDSVVCPDQSELTYSVHDRAYTEIIERTNNFASKRLLQLLMEEKDLMGRLRSVKHYFLLDQGDFVVGLLALCEAELSKNIDDVLPARLEALLEMALRTSVANADIYKDDVHCALQPYTLKSQMMRILSIETSDEREYWPPCERLQLTGLEGFALTFHVTWPISLVLDRKALTQYQMIFRHLFHCKHVERLLCRVWLSNKVAKSFSFQASRTYAAAFTLRQRMLNFIQNIEYYMMIEVIERNWDSFINKMQKVENIDEVLSFHSDFLGGCLKDCMLTSPELLHMICKLTKICINFATFILSPELDGTLPESASAIMGPEASESFEQTIARFDLEFTGMLVTLVDRISDMGKENYNDALINVLYRLDFSNFYTQKTEGLRGASSPDASLEYNSGGPVSG